MPGIPDDERPLTPKGRAKFSPAAKGLARIAADGRPALRSQEPIYESTGADGTFA
jgi:phosphohistidine phosphatase SixA